MIKKVLFFLVVLAFCFTVAAPVMAAELPKQIDKLAKGTVEIVKSPIVIYDHTKSTMDSTDNKAFGMLKGLIESPFHVVKKAGYGAIDVVTFLVE
jgi:alcohol dehydrogenase YqhD (iron-dependent ADH family)